MDPVTVGVIIAVGVGMFALGAILANLLHGREGRSLGAEYAEGVQDGREGERTRLEAVIKYHEQLTSGMPPKAFSKAGIMLFMTKSFQSGKA